MKPDAVEASPRLADLSRWRRWSGMLVSGLICSAWSSSSVYLQHRVHTHIHIQSAKRYLLLHDKRGTSVLRYFETGHGLVLSIDELGCSAILQEKVHDHGDDSYKAESADQLHQQRLERKPTNRA